MKPFVINEKLIEILIGIIILVLFQTKMITYWRKISNNRTNTLTHFLQFPFGFVQVQCFSLVINLILWYSLESVSYIYTWYNESLWFFMDSLASNIIWCCLSTINRISRPSFTIKTLNSMIICVSNIELI